MNHFKNKFMKTFLLTAIGYRQVKEVYRNTSVTLGQVENKRLQKQSQYKGFRFEVRTLEGFKAKKVLGR